MSEQAPYTFEIRPIIGISETMRRCTVQDCQEPATFYLAYKLPRSRERGKGAESRIRRCELHAREFSAKAKIPFPAVQTPQQLLHILWKKAVGTPNYDKAEWEKLESILKELA